jgi:hypothetical protein
MHEMDEAKAQEVVHEDGRCLVSLLGECPFSCAKKPTWVETMWVTDTHSPGLVATKTW